MLALQASTRERQLTILDLPLDLLKRVVGAVDNIQHLRNLTQVALVSRSFGAVTKQQQHITVSGRDLLRLHTSANHLTMEAYLERLDSQAGLLSMKQFPLCLKFVTYLELQKVKANQAKNMLQLACSFRGLMILDVCFTILPVDAGWVHPMFESLVLHGAASLQEVHISHNNGILLKVVSPGGPLKQHDHLPCITAGNLSVLRDLVHNAAFSCMRNPHAKTQKTLSLLPALQWLELGDELLGTPFKGTVWREMTDWTADAFLQATVGHVTGIHDISRIEMDLTRPLNSSTSWQSVKLASPRLIAQLAPNLTILNIKISHSSDSWVVLTPKLVSVDVTKPKHLGPMLVEGVPNTALTHMCLQGHPLWVDEGLHSWGRARQSQLDNADLDVQVEFSNILQRVAMTSHHCTKYPVSALCFKFSHGCAAVMIVDLPHM